VALEVAPVSADFPVHPLQWWGSQLPLVVPVVAALVLVVQMVKAELSGLINL
jgi:hypothetical protein